MVRRNVLVIDDDALLLRSISRCLYRQPYTLYTAHDAEEAIEAIKSQRIDLIVLDQQMPGLKGTELARWVAGHCPTIKTIMLTGNASLETAMAAINEGNIFRFFTKPCDIVELALAIRQALEQKAREESHLHQENTEKGRASATDLPVRCEVAFPNQLQAEKAIVDPFLRSETSETDSRGRFSRGIMMMEARVRRWLDRERIEGIETVFDVQVLERHREWEEYTAIPDAILLSFEEDKVSHVASICHGLKGVLWKNAPTILAFCYPGEDRSIASALSVGFDECLSPRMGTEEMVARCLAAVRARRLDQVLAGGTDWGEEAPDALAAS